ncbi:MAG TPA: UvrD-helicase domain-containing protein [Kofleriaceae bacterium]|nr:UvrD-helicase domain-containing protein [Kofleriaceae bacterium]
MAIDLAKLNPPQRAAVAHGGGPLLVLAGAGSGKTRVITFRIVRLIEQGIPPEAICAVTFTNKAAEEMRERVAYLLGDKKTANRLVMGTFHSLGLRVLREERKALGFPAGFTIYDASDQLGALRECLRGIHDGDRRFDVKAVLTRISLAKNAFITPDAYEPNEADDYDAITAQVYGKYQETLRAAAAFDFDDLIVEPVRLFREVAEVGEKWRARFRYVLVDEYQDTNKAQLHMIEELVREHGNLTVVGDDDQSIYSWRGADPTNILRFDEMFPGATVVKLEQNYRSSKTILDAANAVIANNKLRHGKTLWSEKGTGKPILHAVARDTEQEAQWVARELLALHESGKRWDAMAVMYRSNIQAKLLEEQFREHGVPYVMYGGQQFFERKEVKDVIAYLRVAVNPKDELALRRIINYPARGIGATTVERLVARAHARHASLWDVLVASRPDLADDDLRPATRTAIADLVAVLARTRNAIEDGHSIVGATKDLIDDIKLYDDLRDASPSLSAAQRRIDNVTGLIGSLERHEQKSRGVKDLAEYLRQLSLQSDGDDDKDTKDKVIMTTLHGAKGLEFPICFIVGMEEELLPHARTLNPQVTDVMDPDHATDVSEERRLCYVGITRAQEQLYLTRACQRVSRGRPMVRTPSRFLLEIPDDLLDVKDLAEEALQEVPREDVKSFFAKFSFDE